MVDLLQKNIFKKLFGRETGLLVDMPKGNLGITNDCNTSQRFFENPQLSSDIQK